MDFIDHIRDPGLQRFYRYWDGKRGDAALPRRRDLDPIEMAPWLPRLAIVDRAETRDGFRYRLAGSEYEAIIGTPAGRRPIAEVFDGAGLSQVLATFRKVIHSERGIYTAWRLRHRQQPIGFERLALPIAADDMRCAGLIICMHRSYFSDHAWWRSIFDEVDYGKPAAQHEDMADRLLAA